MVFLTPTARLGSFGPACDSPIILQQHALQQPRISETTLNSRSAEEDESTNDTGLELANACGDVADDNVERELREEEAREAQADAAGGLRIEDARLRPVVGCITSVVSSCRLSRRRN